MLSLNASLVASLYGGSTSGTSSGDAASAIVALKAAQAKGAEAKGVAAERKDPVTITALKQFEAAVAKARDVKSALQDPRVLAVLLPALGLAVLTMSTKVLTGYLAARRTGIALPGRLRAGLALVPRGEFSVVIAGLAVASGIEPRLAPLATAYVLITVVAGPLLARLPDYQWFKRIVRRRMAVRRRPAQPLPAGE